MISLQCKLAYSPSFTTAVKSSITLETLPPRTFKIIGIICNTLLFVLANGNVFLAYSAAILLKFSGPLIINANAQSPRDTQYSNAFSKFPD